jgi:hypothetical protein
MSSQKERARGRSRDAVRKMVLTALLLAALGLAAGARAATVLNRLSNQDLATQADLVVLGTCGKIESQWVGRELVTLVTFNVRETWKGSNRSQVTVVLPGGVDLKGPAPLAMDYGEAPRMAEGEEDVLFLQAIEQVPHGYVILGFTQGRFTVYSDARKGKMATRDLQRVMLLEGRSLKPGPALTLPLAELKEQIRRYLAPQAAGVKH